MLDEWAQYAGDAPGAPVPVLPHKPTPQDVEIITRRMYEKTDHRRKLGMMARDIVQKSFGGERYLREHEQMLWIGKARYEMLGLERRIPPPKHPARMLSLRRRSMRQQQRDTASSNIIDPQMEKMLHPRPPVAKHFSTTTSFSSVYMDDLAGPSNRFSFGDWGPETPDSSVMYPKSDPDEEYFAPLERPPRSYARTHASSSSQGSTAVAMGKRPVQYGNGYGHAHAGGGYRHIPKVDPRRNVMLRQSMQPESARSSLRPRSHLNEVQYAEYGNVDGRL